MSRRLFALDIETSCALSDCPGGAYCRDEKHAIHYHTSKIDCIGLYNETESWVLRGPDMLSAFKQLITKSKITGHRLQFDLRHLYLRGFLSLSECNKLWEDDTNLMAYVMTKKIPDEWLALYEKERQERNKDLPTGIEHREGGRHSLKTLAPYFLGVEPFWEDPTDHDNSEYVLKDCKYSFELRDKLEAELRALGQWEFYKECQLPWTKAIFQAEMQGIDLDVKLMNTLEESYKKRLYEAEAKLKSALGPAMSEFRALNEDKIRLKYQQMYETAVNKIPKDKRTTEKLDKTLKKYQDLMYAALDKAEETKSLELSLSSPLQLKWLLKDYLGFDIRDPISKKETTNKDTLERIAAVSPKIRALLDHRGLNKVVTSYFPAYRKYMTAENKIYTWFNTTITRTGRLSSSNPNLQQVPPDLKQLFRAPEGQLFASRDLSAIEPRFIAYYTKDPLINQLVRNREDFHGETARVIFDYITCENALIKKTYPRQRDVAKTCGLAILYGAGAPRLKTTLDKAGFTGYNIKRCQEIVKRIRARYSGVWEYKLELDKKLMQGETLVNFFGRPIYFDDPEDVYMKGFNRLIQGSASDLVLDWCTSLSKTKGDIDLKPVALVHDELLVKGPKDTIEQDVIKMEGLLNKYSLDGIPLDTEGAVSAVWSK